MKKLLLIVALAILSDIRLPGQDQPQPVLVTRVTGITSSIHVIDNRSALTRRNTIHTFCSTGSGTWSTQLQYSDVSASGPWTSFSGSSSLVNNTTGSCIGGSYGHHDYLRFSITGTASVDYSGTKGFFPPVFASGSIAAPFNATYIVQSPNATLSSAQALNALSNGVMKNTAGVVGIATGSDLPAHQHDTGDLVSGVIQPARGGTGQILATANGILIGNGATFTLQVMGNCSNAITDKLLYNNSTQQFSCGSDQSGGGGTGITSLNGLVAAAQTIDSVNDTNVTLVVSQSSSSNNRITAGWTGTLAKARQHGNTVYTDQDNGFCVGCRLTIESNATNGGLNLVPNSAPSTPVTGDVWLTTAGAALQFRASGVTRTVEVTANKGVANGYAALDGSTKLALANGQEVWAIADLSDISGKQGNASVVMMFGGGAVATDQCGKFDVGGNLVSSGAPCGTVTSINATVPAEFTVTGVPITGSGTIAITKQTQSANTVWAGPTAGGAVAPAFRALVAADIPSLAGTYQILSEKNAASGYAGLTASTKLTASHGQEVWSVTDLTTYSSVSGSGTTALLTTITSPLDNDCLKYSSGNWVNSASCGGGGTPGGATNSVQYNNAGALGGIINGTATRKFVVQTTGVPSFDTLQYGDLPVTAYAADFSSSTTWTLAGTTHGLGTCDLVKAFFYTSGTLRVELEPSQVTCETAAGGTQFDVVATFSVAQAGRMELVRSGGAASGVTIFSGSAALDFGSIVDMARSALTFTVTGAAVGDTVAAGCPATLTAGMGCQMLVSAADTVQVRIDNLTGSAQDLASLTFSARVIR